MKTKQGFTLLEIIIVIAIIGILAGIVLAFLSGARDRAYDASVKSSLNSLRKETEIYFNDSSMGNGTYGTPASYNFFHCAHGIFNGTALSNNNGLLRSRDLIDAAVSASGIPASTGSRCRIVAVGSSPGQIPVTGGWIAAVSLRSDLANSFWCVDSSGNSKLESGAIATTLSGSTLTQCP